MIQKYHGHQYTDEECIGEEPVWLVDQRKKAGTLFRELPQPVFTYGVGITVDTSNLNLDSLDFSPPHQRDSITMSHDGSVDVLDWKTALQQYGEDIKKYYMSTVAINETKITALHAAHMTNAVVVRIPEHLDVAAPIVLSLHQTARARIDHLLILAKQNSKATIITSSTSASPNSNTSSQTSQFRSQIIEVIADDHANITIVDVQAMGLGANNFSIKRSKAERNAVVNWIDCCMGSSFAQSSITNTLNGQHASGTITSMFFGGKGQRYDLYAGTIHNASQTISKLQARGVLIDDAKSTFRGLIAIKPSCSGCEGYQKEDTLLIGDHARIDAVPILEIQNNDVKCGHGTSIGYIDDEKLFYMMSRGLSEEEAKQQIIEGFLGSLVNEIPHEETRQHVMNQLNNMNHISRSTMIE